MIRAILIISKSVRFCRFAAILVASMFGVLVAEAQEDVATERPAIWTGFYAGVHGGWGKLNGSELRGLVGGGHAGFNHQSGGLVVGLEGDYSFSDIDFSNQFVHPFFGPVTVASDIGYLATLRARVGVTSADGMSMLFGTVGYALSEQTVTAAAPLFNLTLDRSIDVHGIVAGAGVEYKLSSNLSARVEAQHFWMGEDGPTWDGRIMLVRAGLSIHLPSN